MRLEVFGTHNCFQTIPLPPHPAYVHWHGIFQDSRVGLQPQVGICRTVLQQRSWP